MPFYMRLFFLVLFFCTIQTTVSILCSDIRHMQLSSNLIGKYIAQCDEQGNWKPKQCHASTGYCWCVDKEGKQLGSSVPATSMLHLECDG